MKFSSEKGIQTGRWLPNELLLDDDINFVGQTAYINTTNLLVSMLGTNINEAKDYVIGGLELTHSTLLTMTLNAGIALSFSGYYLNNSGSWGFVVSAGEPFSVHVGNNQSIAVDSGGAQDRIDLIEVRPIKDDFDSKLRQFKNPVTGVVGPSPTNTKTEYGYEFAVRKGNDTLPLSVEQSDFTFLDSYAAFAGKYCLFSTAFGDYYIWWDVDDGNADPAISGRTGIEIDLASAIHTTATLVATKTETDLIAANVQGISVSRSTAVLSIDTTTYGDYEDATIGDVLGSDLSLVVTDGNGPVEKTTGWIKIAEVSVVASATSIDQDDIVGVNQSYDWNTSAEATVVPVSEFMQTILDDATAADALTTLGITAYIQTLLDDADALAARTTLEINPQWTSPVALGSGFSISGTTSPALAALNETDVAFIDAALELLQTYRFNGSTWSLVGSGLLISGIGNPALAALNETDVAFIDDTLEELRTYRFNGSTWSLVGSGLSIPAIAIQSLTALNGTDVALIDGATELLRTYRFNGSTWSLVGSGLTITGTANAALTALNGTDVAFIDATLRLLQTYRFNGSTWSLVGSGLLISGISIVRLAALNGIDVAFIDTALELLQIYRFNGSTWSLVGSGLLISGIGNPALAALNGIDVAFIDSTVDELQTYRFGFSMPGMVPYHP